MNSNIKNEIKQILWGFIGFFCLPIILVLIILYCALLLIRYVNNKGLWFIRKIILLICEGLNSKL